MPRIIIAVDCPKLGADSGHDLDRSRIWIDAWHGRNGNLLSVDDMDLRLGSAADGQSVDGMDHASSTGHVDRSIHALNGSGDLDVPKTTRFSVIRYGKLELGHEIAVARPRRLRGQDKSNFSDRRQGIAVSQYP